VGGTARAATVVPKEALPERVTAEEVVVEARVG